LLCTIGALLSWCRLLIYFDQFGSHRCVSHVMRHKKRSDTCVAHFPAAIRTHGRKTPALSTGLLPLYRPKLSASQQEKMLRPSRKEQNACAVNNRINGENIDRRLGGILFSRVLRRVCQYRPSMACMGRVNHSTRQAGRVYCQGTIGSMNGRLRVKCRLKQDDKSRSKQRMFR
jgi:hypothetical protein